MLLLDESQQFPGRTQVGDFVGLFFFLFLSCFLFPLAFLLQAIHFLTPGLEHPT